VATPKALNIAQNAALQQFFAGLSREKPRDSIEPEV
jgi:hypothetical protein